MWTSLPNIGYTAIIDRKECRVSYRSSSLIVQGNLHQCAYISLPRELSRKSPLEDHGLYLRPNGDRCWERLGAEEPGGANVIFDRMIAVADTRRFSSRWESFSVGMTGALFV